MATVEGRFKDKLSEITLDILYNYSKPLDEHLVRTSRKFAVIFSILFFFQIFNILGQLDDKEQKKMGWPRLLKTY